MRQREGRRGGGLRLSEADLRFVVQTVATQRSDHDHVMDLVRDKPDILDRMLDDETLFRRVVSGEDTLLKMSPWLLFAILVRRAAREMANEKFTLERISPGERIPVFDSDRVAALLRDPDVRDYLAGLLASFVRTESATVYYKSGRHYRRRRFSDMDVDDMIALASTVAEEFRFPLYRRIGDICLFITGVFPEHAPGVIEIDTAAPVPVAMWRRRERTVRDYAAEAERFYGLAAAHPAAGAAGVDDVLATLASNFSLARKPLNYIADRYIKLHKERLFGQAS